MFAIIAGNGQMLSFTPANFDISPNYEYGIQIASLVFKKDYSAKKCIYYDPRIT